MPYSFGNWNEFRQRRADDLKRLNDKHHAGEISAEEYEKERDRIYEVFNEMEKDILEKTKGVSSDHAWFRKL